MILLDLGKNEQIVDGKGRAVTFGQAEELVRILTGLPDRTPEALWLAVDDHWQQKFILTDNIMQPITSAQLLEVALQYESQIQQIAEKASQAASVQAQHYKEQMQQIGEKLSTFVSAQIYTKQYEIRDKLLQAAKAQAQEPTNLLTGVDWGKLVMPSTASWPSSTSVSQAFVSLTAPAMQKFLERSNAGMQQIAGKMAQGAKSIVEQQIINWGQSALHALVVLDSTERPVINFSALSLFEDAQKQFASIAAASLATMGDSVRNSISRLAPWIEQEKRYFEACAILEIDPYEPHEYYDNLSNEQFGQEVAVARWLKKYQGRLYEPDNVMRLQEFTRTYPYTISRFIGLITGQPSASLRSPAGRNPAIEQAHYSITPPAPDNAGWDAVFDWYYSVPRWVCHGLEKLSEMIGYAYGTVRRMHSLYKDQYGEYPIAYLKDKIK